MKNDTRKMTTGYVADWSKGREEYLPYHEDLNQGPAAVIARIKSRNEPSILSPEQTVYRSMLDLFSIVAARHGGTWYFAANPSNNKEDVQKTQKHLNDLLLEAGLGPKEFELNILPVSNTAEGAISTHKSYQNMGGAAEKSASKLSETETTKSWQIDRPILTLEKSNPQRLRLLNSALEMLIKREAALTWGDRVQQETPTVPKQSTAAQNIR